MGRKEPVFMKKRAKTATVHVSARMPELLRGRLEAAAKRNGVSLNTEMKGRLEASFEAEKMRSVFEEAKAGLDEVFGHLEKRARMLAEAGPGLTSAPTEERVAVGRAINATMARAVTALAEVGYPARREAELLAAHKTKKETKHVTRQR